MASENRQEYPAPAGPDSFHLLSRSVQNCEYPLKNSKLQWQDKTMFIVSEPRRFYSHSPLEIFLEELLRKNNLSIREACKIAGCSPSVLHGWMQGAYPTGTVIHLKKLCNYYGYTLSEGLTGSTDDVKT